MRFWCAGAGIYALSYNATISSGTISNNGLIVSSTNQLIMDCVSNSSTSGVGSISGLNEIMTPNNTYEVLKLINSFNRPGFLRLRTVMSQTLDTSDQGIYTCIIPDSNGKNISLHVGLYPPGFNSMFYHICTKFESQSLLTQNLQTSHLWPTTRIIVI